MASFPTLAAIVTALSLYGTALATEPVVPKSSDATQPQTPAVPPSGAMPSPPAPKQHAQGAVDSVKHTLGMDKK